MPGLEMAERGECIPEGLPGGDVASLCGIVEMRLGLLLEGTAPDEDEDESR